MAQAVKNTYSCIAGDTGDASFSLGSGRSPERGDGNSVQYSCLRNTTDRGGWWAKVHRVKESWTPLSPQASKTVSSPRVTFVRVNSVIIIMSFIKACCEDYEYNLLKAQSLTQWNCSSHGSYFICSIAFGIERTKVRANVKELSFHSHCTIFKLVNQSIWSI